MLLMKKFNIYWTLCVVHCMDLMFEDINKMPSVAEMMSNARKITNFIYNLGWLLAQIRKFYGGGIIPPKVTRFATNYIVLYNFLEKKIFNLKKFFMSDE